MCFTSEKIFEDGWIGFALDNKNILSKGFANQFYFVIACITINLLFKYIRSIVYYYYYLVKIKKHDKHA